MDTANHDQAEAERPTLKSIAALTGLSVATVGRALKDAPDIGEETKRRVRAVAESVGYPAEPRGRAPAHRQDQRDRAGPLDRRGCDEPHLADDQRDRRSAARHGLTQ